MVETTEVSRWLQCLERRDEPRVRLYCFHHAGGMASMFRDWSDAFPAVVETVAVQLPGRAERFQEPAFQRMAPLVERLADVLAPCLDLSYAFFGHSMGAKVAFSLTHALRERGLPEPRMLSVAASTPPASVSNESRWGGSDEELVAYLRWCGGTPPQVLEDKELLAVVLPVLRADLTVVESWSHATTTPLSCPIHAFAGADDPLVPPDSMADWRQQTSAPFSLTTLQGGHFFLREETEPMWRILLGDLFPEGRDVVEGAT